MDKSIVSNDDDNSEINNKSAKATASQIENNSGSNIS